MNLYTIVLYLHVVGALSFGAGALISLVGLQSLHRAQRVAQVRSILGLMSLSGPIIGISMLVNIAAGLYMTAEAWGWQTAWINVAIVSVVLYFAVGAVMGTRRNAIVNLIDDMPDGPLPQPVVQRIHDPLFGTAVYMMLALLLGIVFLMTAKPALNSAIITMVVAAGVGVIAGLPLWRTGTSKMAAPESRRQAEGR